MKSGSKTWLGLLCAALSIAPAHGMVNDAALPAEAVAAEHDYSSIWMRNAFDLKPLDSTVKEEVKIVAPPPNVHLTGITTILGNKRALFLVKETQKPGGPAPKEESMILTEGQREGVLEVLEIHPQNSTVKIKLEGQVSVITFETNSAGSHAGGGPGEGRRETDRAEHRFRRPEFPGNGNQPNQSFPNRPVNSASFTPPGQGATPAYAANGFYAGGFQSPNTSTTTGSTPNSSSAAGSSSANSSSTAPVSSSLPPPNPSAEALVAIAAAKEVIGSGFSTSYQNSASSTTSSSSDTATTSSSGTSTVSAGASSTASSSGTPGAAANPSGLTTTLPPLPTTPPPPLPDE